MTDFVNIAAYGLFIFAGIWALTTVIFGIRGAIRHHRHLREALLQCEKPLVIHRRTLD